MDTSDLRKELVTEVSNLRGISDDTSDEYRHTVNNVSKLNQVVTSQEDLRIKEDKQNKDEVFRRDQLKFDKKKHTDDMNQRDKDRVLDEKRMEYQHQERMEEIKVNRIKAENEKVILEEQKKKSSREFKIAIAKETLLFLAKTACVTGILIVNMYAHANELHFERVENNIVPARCKGYDATMNKMAEVFLK